MSSAHVTALVVEDELVVEIRVEDLVIGLADALEAETAVRLLAAVSSSVEQLGGGSGNDVPGVVDVMLGRAVGADGEADDVELVEQGWDHVQLP